MVAFAREVPHAVHFTNVGHILTWSCRFGERFKA